MKFGSLFSGIGGFDLGFEQAGLSCSWQVEVDSDCNRVLGRQWPHVIRYEDVRDIGKLKSVDVICGGFPCQDLSVAGKRAGLAGERSGLWFEFLRIIGLNKPEWVVIENVPGLFSSNEGEDLTVILDGLEAAGYVFDVDVLDAQYHGVAQRRRRLFIVCQLAESLLKQKTISSALTIAQCLIENSLLVLIAARSPLATNLENLTFDAGEPNLSLKQRMTLFGMQKEGAAQTLAESLAALPQSCGCELAASVSNRGKNTQADLKISRATKLHGSNNATASKGECQNIEPSWKSILDECLPTMSECITSTPVNEITESKIYSCALLTLRIAERIILSPPSCPTFWSAALSTLTAMRAFTDYARQASSSLFTETIWLQPWRDFIGQAVPVCESLGRIGVGSFEQVFPLSESVSWNPPTRREAGPGVTPILEAGARTNGGGHRDGDGIGVEGDPMFTLQSGKQHAVSLGDDGQLARSLTSCKTATGWLDPNEQNFVVAEAVDVRNLRMQPDGTRGTLQHKKSGGYSLNYQNPICFSSKDHGADAGEIAPTLRSQNFKDSHMNGGGQVAIAFAENQRGELRTSDVSPQISCAGGKPGSGYPAVAIETLQPQGYNMGHASPQETNAREVLRALREAVGEKSFTQWGLGILDSFQPPQVLQSDLHGEGFRGAEESGAKVVSGPQASSKDMPKRAMLKVREAGRRRCPPQERRLAGQLAKQLRADLSQLPHEGPPPAWFVRGLWQASEGLGALQQALNTLSEVWRSEDGQAGRDGELDQSQVKETRGVRTYGVRRLTPL